MSKVNWSKRFAARTRFEQSTAVQDILNLVNRPDMISFAGGIPAPEFFPSERLNDVTRRVLGGPLARQALQYGTTEGYVPLREMIAHKLRSFGVFCDAESVLITSGSQQALDLVGKVLIDPGDRVLVEEPTYMGMLDAWRIYGPEFHTVTTDDAGMLPEALHEALEEGPAKLIYLVPNFQNPTGVTTTSERRAEIVRLAALYGVPIVEDDAYGQLRYEGQPVPPLAALGEDVIYLGTFSKTLCPGLRVAWAVGPLAMIRHMTASKLNSDLHTSTFAQIVTHEAARDGFWDEHVQVLCGVYRERRDLMLSLLERLFPPEITWTHPEGGLFLWVRLPQGLDSTDLLAQAVEHGVAYVPGAPFYPCGGGENTLRLNFSNATPQRIEEGIWRLAGVFEYACLVQPALRG